jgi:hypothetical protein
VIADGRASAIYPRDSRSLSVSSLPRSAASRGKRWASNVLPGAGAEQIQLEAVFCLSRGDLPDHVLDLRRRSPVLSRDVLHVVALADGRAGRIELERAPDDLDADAMPEARERGFEPPVADGAPRADDVGPDFHGEFPD